MKTERLLREIIVKETGSKFNLSQALKILLKNKNWQNIVKKVLSDKKDAGIKDALLISAVLALSAIFQTTSAEELISKIETQITQQIPEDTLVNKIDSILPYPVTATDLFMLTKKNPLTGKLLFSLNFFKKTLKEKVEKAMEKDVIPGIKKDKVLNNIDSTKIIDLVLKAFKKKLADPKHSEALKDLKSYLKQQNQDMKIVDDVVEQTIKSSFSEKSSLKKQVSNSKISSNFFY
jgi:hypothetical protein